MADLNHGVTGVEGLLAGSNMKNIGNGMAAPTGRMNTREAKRISAKATKQKNKPKPSSATGFG